jgi:hypothetical protein
MDAVKTESIREGAKNHPMPFTRLEVAVLSVVDGVLQVLLVRRAEDPHKGKWALPGGVLRIDKDASLDEAALRVAHERLGVEVPFHATTVCRRRAGAGQAGAVGPQRRLSGAGAGGEVRAISGQANRGGGLAAGGGGQQ